MLRTGTSVSSINFSSVVCTPRPLTSRPIKRSEEQRLNSSHITISYAVFCLKKKKTNHQPQHAATHCAAEMNPQANQEYPLLYKRHTCHHVPPNQPTSHTRTTNQPATYPHEVP